MNSKRVSLERRLLAAGAAVVLGAFLLAGCAGAAATTTTTAATAQDAAAPQAPPDGAAPSGGQGAPPSSGTVTRPSTAAYVQSGGTATKANLTLTAADKDESAVLVSDSGTLTMSGAAISTTGETSSSDSSSFYGLNAAVVATSAGTITLRDSSITTSGSGANGAFATGSGSTVNLENVTIKADGDGGHGVMATQGGAVTLADSKITTSNAHAAPLATDRGSGTITSTGGTYVSTGKDSPILYSTGVLKVTGATGTATGSEAAVIEGGNSIVLVDSTLSSTVSNKWGVMIYQSMSGDAEGTKGTYTMTGGSLSYSSSSGPLFYVTNSTGIITLEGVKITNGSSVLVKAAAGTWGTSGSNGGTVNLTADRQVLAGAITADATSSVNLVLKSGSVFTGSIDSANTANETSITLDAASTWNVTADSYLTAVSDTAGISGTSITNIHGNGHTVYYDSASNASLGGKTWSLAGGGSLTPAS